MTISALSTQGFKYLGDGDGFPTEMRYRYWRDYQSAYLNSYRIRTSDQQTAYSSNYVQQFTNFGDFSTWNNASGGDVKKGKINYFPMSTEEAMKVFWKLSGVEFGGALSFSFNGAKVTSPSYVDINDSGSNLVTPYQRIWSSLVGQHRVNDFDSTRVINEQKGTGANAVYFYKTGSVSYDLKIRAPWSYLTRFGNKRYGFEPFLDATFSQGGGVDSADVYNKGGAASSVRIILGSQQNILTDEVTFQGDNGYDLREVEAEVVYIDGIPLILQKIYNLNATGAYKGLASRLSTDVTGLRFWAVSDG